MTWRQVVIASIVLGIVAGAVVMWLQRFEVTRLHTQMGDYLEKWDKFSKWDAEHGSG